MTRHVLDLHLTFFILVTEKGKDQSIVFFCCRFFNIHKKDENQKNFVHAQAN